MPLFIHPSLVNKGLEMHASVLDMSTHTNKRDLVSPVQFSTLLAKLYTLEEAGNEVHLNEGVLTRRIAQKSLIAI